MVESFVAALTQIAPIVYGLFVAAGLDVLTGLYGAWRSGTLDPEFFPTFIQSHILERIIPILIVLAGGVALGDPAGPALIVAGGAAAAAYVASVVGSISDNLGKPKTIPVSEGGAS